MHLNDIANQLLDLGKRNRLLNYKETGLKSIAILNKNYKDIYVNITSGKEFSFLQSDVLLERYHKTFAAVDEEDITSEYSKAKVYDICKEACKPTQFIGYKKGYKLDKVLKALMKEYRYSITEKGINSLYLSFGFVNYTEGSQSYKAPLLLIPVEYSKNPNGGYKISASDDDIFMNPTLDFYFNTTRKFDIPDYDKEDFDYDTYIESIKSVLPKDVIYEDGMSLGIYSFMKISMYKDLMDHDGDVLANKNIQALLGHPSMASVTLDGEVLPVVNCDSSQLLAIETAVSGKSFCLQGPPGSGKSQTITNIIASLIGNGRHVLFVSEKLQALQVVYENLRRAGLSDFAIELHSSKANKKTFIENMYKTAILPKYQVSNFADDVRCDHEVTSKYITEYQEALTKIVPGEKITIFELFSLYLSARGEELKFKIENPKNRSLSESLEIERLFREYVDAISPLGYDYRQTVFYGFNSMDKSYLLYDMDKEFSESILYLNRLLDYKETLDSLIAMDKISKKPVNTIQDLYKVFDFIPVYNETTYEFHEVKTEESCKYCLDKMEEYFKTPGASHTLALYDKEILNTDLEKTLRKFKSFGGLFKGFNSEYKSLKREILSYRRDKTNDKTIIKELQELIDTKANLKHRKSLREDISKFIPYITNENMKDVYDDLVKMSNFITICPLNDKAMIMNSLLDTMLSFKNYQEEDIMYLKLSVRFDGKILDFYTSPISVIRNHLYEMYQKKDAIPSYLRVLQVIDSITKANVLEFLHMYLDENMSLELIDVSYRKTYIANKVYAILEQYPQFRGFSSNMFKERVSEFVSLDEKIMNLNRDYIIATNSQRRPDDVLLEGSQFKILTKEANKVRKQKPVRLLLSEIFDLALAVKPVFLMSPLSVSTYLSSDNVFDCVIFDEASQIFAQDAFGAIYRGKQCIIIGDSKQMPPSNFFGASSQEDEDEEDYDSGMESILDMAAAYMPTSSLKWHYRSRSEELITFSNKAFYDNSLITIPQAHKHEKGFGIDFEFVPNGIYDARSRTNQREAELISDMVLEHYRTSTKSLGVVAFSKVQADLIEDLVDKKLEKCPEIQKYFTDEVEEPFFVKNLETVQGDERDRIIFSICYGYNSEGKFYQRFGPLNNLGGERRLNVAVTRSKYNITIVSSIHSTDIREDKTESIGVKLLKEYLEFAENVVTKKNSTETDNGLLKTISEFLYDNNYECLPNYGTSSFRIPLAVREKGSESFTLAIMLDPKDKTKNTTDQNRLEKLLLERQGWKYYKCYTVAWVNDRITEEKKLLDFLNSETSVDIKKEDTITFIEETEDSLESRFIEYKELSNELLVDYYETKGLQYALKEIIQAESPVTMDYIYRKASIAMGKTKVSNVVKNEVSKNMPECSKVGDTIWSEVLDVVPLRINSSRMINEIPVEELKEGLYVIIEANPGITQEGASRAILKILGFSRLTENTKKILHDAIIYLKLDGRLIQKGEGLYI